MRAAICRRRAAYVSAVGLSWQNDILAVPRKTDDNR